MTPDPDLPDTPSTQVADPVADPYKKRYNDLRPQYTQATQKAAELEAWRESLTSDPAVLRAFLTEQGYEMEDEPEPQYDSAAEERLAAIERQQQQTYELLTAREQREADAEAQRTEQAGIAKLEAAVEAQLLEVTGATDIASVDSDLRDFLEGQALYKLPPREDGSPDIKGAHERLVAWQRKNGAAWAQTKNAPAPPGPGKPSTQVPNLDNRDERVAHMKRQLQVTQ